MKYKMDALYLMRFNGLTPEEDLRAEFNSLNDQFHETQKSFLEKFSEFNFSDCHRSHAEMVSLNCKMQYLLRMIECKDK